MYPQTIAIDFIRFAPPQGSRPRFVRAHLARRVTLGLMLILAIGCGGGGSGGGEVAPAAIASAPVDLPPGQTTARLEWAPSAGDVSGYYVLESRGGANFRFTSYSSAPGVEISGVDGDRVRIQVMALSRSGTTSALSPPSVEMRFHAAVEAATAQATTTTSPGIPNTIAAVNLASEPDAATDVEASDVAALDATEESVSNTESLGESDPVADSDQASDAAASIDPILRTRLLGADVRFSLRAHGRAASQWLQDHVDAEVGAGLSLVGTGRANSDAFRELIWTDQAGQLFVSDGALLATAGSSIAPGGAAVTNDPTMALVEAVRLRATERFLGLADFDADGVGDWLIEDSVTLEVWLMNGETQEVIAVEGAGQLVGHGDFDGDGRSELLWSDAEGSLRVSRPTPAFGAGAGAISWLGAAIFDAATSRLLTVADLNGDGLDDLLLIDTEGRLQEALSVRQPPEADDAIFAPSIGSARSTHGLELIATLDLDGDGSIEIAWHDGIGLELWNTADAP